MQRSPSTDSLTRKEREKLARQQEILTAARELFSAKGFRDTTLDEIAHHAEFGKGTIYNYFSNKEELFFGIVEQSTADLLKIAREAVAVPGSAKEKLQTYAESMMRYIQNNGELIHVIYHELHRGNNPANLARLKDLMANARKVWEILADPLRREIESGALLKADPRQLMLVFDSMLRGYCFDRFAFHPRRPDDDFTGAAEMLTRIFFHGIAQRQAKG